MSGTPPRDRRGETTHNEAVRGVKYDDRVSLLECLKDRLYRLISKLLVIPDVSGPVRPEGTDTRFLHRSDESRRSSAFINGVWSDHPLSSSRK